MGVAAAAKSRSGTALGSSVYDASSIAVPRPLAAKNDARGERFGVGITLGIDGSLIDGRAS
jgi:hypothetical protein